MNKYQLQAEIKSVAVCYLLFLFLCQTHYAYRNQWGLQILFWFSLGGLGFWWLFDLFTLWHRVGTHNRYVQNRLFEMEKEASLLQSQQYMALLASGNITNTEVAK